MHQKDTCHTIARLQRSTSSQYSPPFQAQASYFQVREVKEELRSMRLEAHTKQLTKELKSARAALENERKLRKVQSDTIKVNIY